MHALWGQGGPIRGDDELTVEHAVRVHWVYFIDSWFSLFVVWELLKFGHHLVHDVSAADPLSLVYTCGVTLFFVLTNSFFVHSMITENRLGVRLVIVANATFGVGLLTIFIAGAWRAREEGRFGIGAWCALGRCTFGTWLDFYIWLVEVSVVVFLLVLVYIYARLWSVYPEGELELRAVSSCLRLDARDRRCVYRAMQALLAALTCAVSLYTLVSIYYFDEHHFWEAFM